MPTSFQSVFTRLRALLKEHAREFPASHDTSDHYGLEAPIGPSTVKAWGGKTKTETVPIAWVETGKTFVSYHLVGLNGNTRLVDSMSEPLRARMHGKTCFNFKTLDDVMLTELHRVTAESLRGLKKAGFIA